MGVEVKDFDNDLATHITLYPYISNRPMTKEDPKPMPDGNPITYLGLVLCGKIQHFPMTDDDTYFVNATYSDCKKEPGLITKGRHKFEDHCTHDDGLGMSYAAAVTGHVAALDIYNYGKKHNWLFNSSGRVTWFHNEEGKFQLLSKLKCWHARLPGVVAHYKIAASFIDPSIKINLFDRLWWCLRILTPNASESATQLDWMMIDLYLRSKKHSGIMDLASYIWEVRMYNDSRYPHLMGSVFEKYFNKAHILAKWMRGLVFKTKE